MRTPRLFLPTLVAVSILLTSVGSLAALNGVGLPLLFAPRTALARALDGPSVSSYFAGDGIDQQAQLDWGDAPGDYPQFARHNLQSHPNLHLGTVNPPEPPPDAEAQSQPDEHALGDDLAGHDDEEGVEFVGTASPCAQINVRVEATAAGILNAWIDYNGDNDWADLAPNEHVFSNWQIAQGTNNLPLNIPCDANTGTTFSRFRLTTEAGIGFSDSQQQPAPGGEIEDHQLIIHGADLAIAKLDDPDPVEAGNEITYSLTVHNSSPVAAENTVITDTLPQGLDVTVADPSQGICLQGTSPLRCELGQIGPGGDASVVIVALVSRPGNSHT